MPAGKATAYRAFNCRLAPTTHEFLRRHAFERNVSLTLLINDILRLWVIAATDTSDTRFGPQATGYALPEPPPDRYPGYLQSLVFMLEDVSAH
jgi:hypothetical protein